MKTKWNATTAIAAIVMFMLTVEPGYGEEEVYHFTGTVITFEGQTVEGMLFSHADDKTGKTKSLTSKISLNIKNTAGVSQWYEVPLTDVEKIIFDSYKDEGRQTNCVVVLKNGKTFAQKDHYVSSLIGKTVFISSRHPVTGKLAYDKINCTNIKEIRFHEPYGQIRRDGMGHTFPADYEYSPYTGKPMSLETVEQP